MKEEIEDLKNELEELETELQRLENKENEDEYDDMIDETNNEIKIFGAEYHASRILKELDSIAYDCGMDDFNDERISELQEEIEDKKQEIEDLSQ